MGSRGAEGRCHCNQFSTQFAITGFVDYNFDCMIASDTLFDSRGWVSGVKLSDEDIAEIECLRVVAWQPLDLELKLLLTGFVGMIATRQLVI